MMNEDKTVQSLESQTVQGHGKSESLGVEESIKTNGRAGEWVNG